MSSSCVCLRLISSPRGIFRRSRVLVQRILSLASCSGQRASVRVVKACAVSSELVYTRCSSLPPSVESLSVSS